MSVLINAKDVYNFGNRWLVQAQLRKIFKVGC